MDWKPIKDNKWLMVLAVLGVLFLVFGSFLSRQKGAVDTLAHPRNTSTADTQPQTPQAQSTAGSNTDYEHQTDSQLTTILGGIEGIRSVSVMVTVDSSAMVAVANNTQETKSDSGSGKGQSTTESSQVFTETNSDGTRTPYIIKRAAPTVRGVLVTVNADDFYLAKSEIIDAITNVLDVPAYKISVEPQKAG